MTPAPNEPPVPEGPVLREGELTLRPPRREEAALYASWWSDPEAQWGFCSQPRDEAEIREAFPEMEHEARDIGHWIDFVLEVEGRPAGALWLSRWDLDAAECDLNILIGDPALRGRGIGRRAIRLLCAWALPVMGLRRIRLLPREDHYPGIRSYRAAGARLGGIADETVTWRGETVLFRELWFLPEDFSTPPGEPAAPPTGASPPATP